MGREGEEGKEGRGEEGRGEEGSEGWEQNKKVIKVTMYNWNLLPTHTSKNIFCVLKFRYQVHSLTNQFAEKLKHIWSNAV